MTRLLNDCRNRLNKTNKQSLQYYLIITELMCDINNSFYDNTSSSYPHVQLKHMIINQF